MKVDRFYALSLIMVACACLVVGYAVAPVIVHKTPSGIDNVYWLVERADGSSFTAVSGNMMTDQYENMTRDILGWYNGSDWSPAAAGLQYVALGNASISSALTSITDATTAGFERVGNDSCVQWSYGGHSAFNVTKKFTATATINVNAAGFYWDASGNSLGAAAALPQATTFNTGDNCTVVEVIELNMAGS
jgi:hypothetical protein